MKNQCYYCDKEFEAIRDTAKYCSNSCRTLANKQRRKNELLAETRNQEQQRKDDQLHEIAEEKRMKREKKAMLRLQLQNERDELARLNAIDIQQKAEQLELEAAATKLKLELESKQKLESELLKKKQKAIQDETNRKRELEIQRAEGERNAGLYMVKILFLAALGKTIFDMIIRPTGNEGKPNNSADSA